LYIGVHLPALAQHQHRQEDALRAIYPADKKALSVVALEIRPE
jgi:hypothetical protein